MNSHSGQLENALESLQFENSRNSCLLSNLPSELRSKVFEFLTESAGEMRLVSKSWCAMIDDWAIPDNIPATLLESENSMNVIIELRKSEAACFGKLRELSDELNRDFAAQTFSEIRTCKDISFDIPYDSPDLYRIRDAMSTRVKLVHITRSEKEHEGSGFYDAVCKLLEPVKQATDLTLSRHKFLLDLSSHIAIRKVSFVVDTLSYPNEILLDICERIEYISIRLYNSQLGNATTTTSLCEASSRWVGLVLGMFHYGARSIELSNYYVDLFSAEQIRRIAETLVSRGTPFHFQAVLHQQPTPIIVNGLRKRICQSSDFWIVDISSTTPPPHATLVSRVTPVFLKVILRQRTVFSIVKGIRKGESNAEHDGIKLATF
ncbi:hypothetical protein PRIPAC_94067 [Pristionchus pacificus]|uniref:Uncharacterized protein n=1 Tax=Pristionchus pacificus TaxID=54126 RepID=A0A2A6BIH9_PRIPA|nr:hypothetical protein PRIPAC_94067 [Pristionchus pacificus]|eukprot:PDM65714.1 hypothetical protein PRIPAC_45628 [Pristionchus pacificus]